VNEKISGASPARGSAATQTFPRQRVGQADCNTTGQFELRYDETLTTAQRFEQFHQTNPHIYQLLVTLAREWLASTGQKKLGVRALWERMRWQLAITTDAPDYKLNDHYTSFYARLIEHQEPDLRGMFELRSSPEADRWIKQVTS
jgi:hypothetical protein